MGLKSSYATLQAAGFGAPLGATVVWPQGRAGCGMRPRYPWPKGSKKHSCNPAGCGIWRALGGDGRLASRPGELRTESAVPLAQRALKNIHPTLRAAAFNAPSGATIVWPQGRANCGLRSRYLSPKGLKNIHATLRAAGFGAPLGATIVWPQGRAGCGMCPQNLTRKGAKKTFMQPCELRDLTRPWGRLSLGLKAERFADCIRGTLAERGTLQSVNEG